MISLAKFWNQKDDAPEPPPDSGDSSANHQPDLAVALRQAMRILVEGMALPNRAAEQPDEERKRTITGLLDRLEGSLLPFDAIEIATSAVALFEEDAQVAQNRRHEEHSSDSSKQAEVSRALLQALKTLLEGLPLEKGSAGPGASRTIPELARRLDGALQPFDVLEIAGEALTVWENHAREAEERQRNVGEQLRTAEQQAELVPASLRALQILLEGAPSAGQSSGEPEPRARRILAELRSRCEGPLRPAEVIGIAEEAVTALQEGAHTAEQSRLDQQQHSAVQQAALSSALLQGLQRLLAALPFSDEADTAAPETGKQVIAELLRRLGEPLAPAEVMEITDQAAATLRREALTRMQLAAKPAALSGALLEALQMLLGTWPRGDASGKPDGRKTIDQLLHRLEQPLEPFDVVEIASDAVAMLQQDTPSAPSAPGDDRRRDTHTIDISQALLEALRMILGGCPIGTGSEPRANRVITELLRRLEGPLVPFDVLEIANEALGVLEQDGKATLERHRLQNEELQAMISMLTETVAGFSTQKNTSVTRLQEVERRIEQASKVEDLRLLKANLADCLDAVREASANQQKQSSETIQLLERQIQAARSRLSAVPRPEAVPVRLEGKPEADVDEYIVVFLLDRESSIGARFGADVRQSVLQFVNRRLKEALTPSDRVVRWKGAAYLASLKRASSVIDVRAELSSVAAISVPPVVEIGNRSVRLPISLSWALFPKSRFASLDRLFEKVDEFIARAPGHAVS